MGHSAIEAARGVGTLLAAYPSAREWYGELEGRRCRAPDAGRRSRHVWSGSGQKRRCVACLRIFGRGSRAARGVCGGPARGVAEVLAAANANGHVLWAADVAGEQDDAGREAACVLFCAACGSYVIEGTPQRLRRCCPGHATTRAAGRALARI